MPFARSPLVPVALALSTLLVAAPSAPPFGGNVLVVDDGGSEPFVTIQSAVHAAIDGDVILVRTGTYAGFEIANKSVVVVGDVGGAVSVQGSIHVNALSASRTVVLANLLVTGSDSGNPVADSGLDCAENAGIVRAESCSFSGGGFGSSRGVRVRACADVSLTNCQLRGGTATTVPTQSAGVEVVSGARVTVYDSQMLGGAGTPIGCAPPHDGRHGGFGGVARDSFLFGSGSTFEGGRGGDAQTTSHFSCSIAGSGGTGIAAQNGVVRLLDCTTTGGQPGDLLPGCGPCGTFGYAGPAQTGSTFTPLSGSARSLAVTTPALAGSTATIALSGTSGDRVSLLVSDTTTPSVFMPRWHGMLLVPNPRTSGATTVVPAGTIPASGQMDYALTLPPPGPGARTIHVQGVFRDTQGLLWLSGARSVTVLP